MSDWTSMTKEEHDEVMRRRRRPVTDDPIKKRPHNEVAQTKETPLTEFIVEKLKGKS